MAVVVRPAVAGDEQSIAELLLRVSEAEAGGYPPAYVPRTLAGVREWLERYPMLHRLVAVDQGVIVGHAAINAPKDTDPDLPRWFDEHYPAVSSDSLMEITRVFVSPAARRSGIGGLLLDEAVRIVAAYGRRPALCVMDTMAAARATYTSAGWEELGEFMGVSGRLNYVFLAPDGDHGGERSSRAVASAPGWAFETRAIHAGVPEGDEHGPVTVPISLSTTYRVTTPGTYGRWAYARSANPTRAALEEALNTLEGGAGAGAFASGLAAIDAALRMAPPGGRVVVSNDVYGGTWRLLDTIWGRTGFEVEALDLTDPAANGRALNGAAMIIIETPSNPMLRMIDIAAVAERAHQHGALVVVDNTFATPYLQTPLALGADLVVHSTSKYLGGHTDVIGGALVARTTELADRIHYLQRAAGAVASPFDAYLVLRGIRTLPVRMDRQCANAMAIAEMLSEHDAVAAVHYPGLSSDPGFRLASKQMRAPGGMVSFRHAGGRAAAVRTVRRTRLFTLAESLGAVESLVELPAAMTHAVAAGSLLEVPDDLIRLSVGLEHIDDLLEDLAQALAA